MESVLALVEMHVPIAPGIKMHLGLWALILMHLICTRAPPNAGERGYLQYESNIHFGELKSYPTTYASLQKKHIFKS